MDRSNIDPFWNHVLKMDDGSMKCEFCDRPFPKGTSISRIKWHLSGEKGHGVAICTGQVPKDVQEAAFIATRGISKRQKTIASFRNVNDNAISSCPQEENDEVNNLATDAGRIQMAVQGTVQGVGEGRNSSLAEAGNLMENMTGEMMHIDRSITAKELIVDAQETRGEASQAPDIVGQAIGRSWDEIRNLLMEDDIENGSGGVAWPGGGASSSGELTRNTNEIKGDVIPTTKLVGQAFEDNKKTIWSWLMNDEVSSIGIYGMGGVGKTTLVKHIYNQLLERSDNHVYWITVSQDFSIKTLQNSIANRIGLHLSKKEEDELQNALALSKELMKKKKWVLILDDLWNSFQPCKVGIPVQEKGRKLILTTRSRKVCQEMDIQNKIKVNRLSETEAWTLFMEQHRHSMALSPEVKKIAQSITDECAGLPLGIKTVAGVMKGVDDIHEWRNALEELRQSRFTQDKMEEEVFNVLRFSYNHLKDAALQQCFLYCALFPEDFKIPREDLIAYLIDEGVIKGLKRREAEFDKGHSMLNRLENVSLLEGVTEKYGDSSCVNTKRYGDCRYVKMHDLIRDMAIQIQQEDSSIVVKAGANFEFMEAEEWTDNLVRVSLIHTQLQENGWDYSPRCPNLSTLLLCSTQYMRFMVDSFFEEMYGLKVLDLSHTGIVKLPDSVSDLESLSALLLKSCSRLRHVPSLEKLRALKRLDLSSSKLEKMPQGMECLSNLRYLRLNGCGEKEFPSGILPKLSRLQVLILEKVLVDREYVPVKVKGKEVACLKKLETLECHFECHSEFVEYLQSRDETQSPSKCKILVGQLGGDSYRSMRDKSVVLGNFNINTGGFLALFPNDIQDLKILECNAATSLCHVSSLRCATQLERIHIEHCKSMKTLLSTYWFGSTLLPSISPPNGMFSGLKEFHCHECNSMKKLFPLVFLPNLINLEVLQVKNCGNMEEIVATRDEEGVMAKESSSCYSNIEFNLPKLRILELSNLPQLKSICGAKLICCSLEEIEVWDCEKLKRISVSLPLLDNGQPSPPPSLRRMIIYPKEWWESVVEWEHPNAKDVLYPFVKFY